MYLVAGAVRAMRGSICGGLYLCASSSSMHSWSGWLLARLLVYLPMDCFCLAEASFDWFQLRQMGYVMNGLGRASWTCLCDGIGTLGNDIWRMVDDRRGFDGPGLLGGRLIRSRYHQIPELLPSIASST